MNFITTERIWWLIGGAMLLLTVAAATSALAQDGEQEKIVFEARELLNRARYEDAARRYAEAYELEKTSSLAADALYWRAFALYRTDETRALRNAVEALETQQERFPDSSLQEDSLELMARVHGELARRGDGRSVRWIKEHSDQDDRDDDTRAAALQALMMMDPDSALPIVKKILADDSLKNADLRRQAMFIVGQMDNEEAEVILIGMLESERDPELKGEIIMWLSMNGSERSLDAIMKAYRENDDPELGEAALFAMGQHGGERAVALLKEIALDADADPELRSRALFSLSQVGRDDEIGQLIVQVLHSSDDPEVQEMALFSLSHVGGELPAETFLEIIRAPGVDDELRAQALHFAGTRGDIDASFVKEVYDSAEDSDLRAQCCWVLSEIGTDEALDVMIGIVRAEPDEEVRQNAVFWIGQFGNEKAADFLLELIHGE